MFLTQASANAYLFQGLRKGVISGISLQTVVASAVCGVLIFIHKVYWLILNLLNGVVPLLGVDAYLQKVVAFVNMCLLLVCVRMCWKAKACVKGDSASSDDDFGKLISRSIWQKVFGHESYPPACLQYSLIYVVAATLAFFTALASTSFSLSALATWAYDRPTAMTAILDNFLRGLALLPQLHLSRKAGVVAPTLAAWIALMGFVDVVELMVDGVQWSSLVYTFGDAFSLALVSDFMYLFVRSRLRGQKAVEIVDNV
jgi:hypothetical protein